MGDLAIPAGAEGLVVFAHGSGSSRFSSRNRFVARDLARASFGTLLLDLLTAAEEETDLRTRELRFDIDLLTRRLAEATDWAEREFPDLPLGYFGASTGAAAALKAAAVRPAAVRAIVSRGGRPDLAGDALQAVQAPALLIVGGNDEPVIRLNKTAFQQLKCVKRLEIVPGATHLLEEAGALEQVSQLAREWFARYLVK